MYIVEIEQAALNVVVCLRCAGLRGVGGAFAARAGMAADVLRDGHGQDVGRLLHHRLESSDVSPSAADTGEIKVQLAIGAAALAEQPDLEALLIICGGGRPQRHVTRSNHNFLLHQT